VAPNSPASVDDGVNTGGNATSSPIISWPASSDTGSGIASYEVAIGTTAGASDTSDFTDVGNVTSASVPGLGLTLGSTYFGTVRALDTAGLTSAATDGDGFIYGWIEQAYIKASNAEESDHFDVAVDISGDYMVVGARYEDSSQTTITNGNSPNSDNSKYRPGAAYVFVRSGTTWTQQAYLKAPNGDISDFFGHKVAISGDTIVVAASREGSNQTTITNGSGASSNNLSAFSGAAYIFVRSGTSWTQQAYLKSPNSEYGDGFGYSVAISGDTIVVGVDAEDSNQTTITNGSTASDDNSLLNSGAAYVFVRSGTTWTSQAYLKAPNKWLY
jgi:hypothetical protein